ncbi:Nudix hydrolase 22 [Morus notabilis]|uniref:Nudix hydrolase 22 n=1 Tax=Morus notabilis TaxID=981085 RepID=W9QZU3_9ROSA|nr:Nudix hydrolase 22 [Morus notabilis]
MACIDPVVLSCIPKQDCGSQTLQRIARQLQFYKPPKLDREDQKDVGRGPIYAINEQLSACADWRKRKAAVLICLFEGPQGELRVILTKRSMKLLSYPGDVALPGGKMEEGDVDYSATALREAMEEIGLDSSLVQVVANLEPFISMQHLLKVIPVIGLLDRAEDFKPALNIDEVDAVFDVPLDMFLKIFQGEQIKSSHLDGGQRSTTAYINSEKKFKSIGNTFLV